MPSICAALLAFGAVTAAPVDLYVSPKGDDRWSGRLAAPDRAKADGPLATLGAARLKLRAVAKVRPATVHVLAGTYRLTRPLTLTPEDSGTSAAPRTWHGPPADGSAGRAVISGLKEIKGWRKSADGRVRTVLPEVKSGKWDFVQLYVNGGRRNRPRLPKRGYFTIAGHADPTPASKGKGNDRFRFGPGQIKGDWENRDDVDVLAFHEWIMSRNRIREVDAATNTVTFQAPTGTDAPWRDFLEGHRFLVENVKEALSEPGEWYLDRPAGVLTYLPKPGETIARLRFEAPVAECLIEFAGDPGPKSWVHDIRINGLSLEGTNWLAPKAGRNFPQAEADLSGAVRLVGARNVQIGGCEILRTGTYAVDVGPACQDVDVVKNTMRDLGAGGVKVGEMAWQKDPDLLTQRCRIQANTIEGGGRIHPAAVGVWVGQNPYVHVGGNFIRDFYYTGVSVGWSWGYQENGAHHNTVAGNRISDIGQGVLSDMGGVYTLGPQSGTRITGNRIHDVQSFSYGGWGIYPDEGSTGIVIEDNVVFRTKSAPFHQHYGRENVVQNNVFAYGGEAQVMRSRAEPHLSFTFERNLVLFADAPLLGSNWTGDGFKMDHNLYWREGGKAFDFAGAAWEAWRARGQDLHSVISDPMFRDPMNGDFRLRAGSPALALGFRPFSMLDPANDRTLSTKLPRAFP